MPAAGVNIQGLGLSACGYLCLSYSYSPHEVDRIWGIWRSYYNVPKAIFCLLKGDCLYIYQKGLGLRSPSSG